MAQANIVAARSGPATHLWEIVTVHGMEFVYTNTKCKRVDSHIRIHSLALGAAGC